MTEEFQAFVAASSWRFASTMPQSPHWYTLRGEGAASGFDGAVRFIRQHGHEVWFRGRPYICYDLDGWRYWSMGAPVAETILINRARIPVS
jgi:hypothetical protein